MDEALEEAATSSIPKQEKTVFSQHVQDDSVSCSQLMDRFHETNRIYRHLNAEQSPGQGHALMTPEPLINYAYYAGQGFGRLIEHTALHCVLALALDRPCVLDMEDRDPYYTWRSFVWRGSYDWELDGSPAERHKIELRQAMAQIKGNEKDQKNFPSFNGLELMKSPVDWGSNKRKLVESEFWDFIELWRPENITKALLSPNWGLAWFPHLPFPSKIGGCDKQELLSRMINVMYQPTPLSRKLIRERQERVLNTSPVTAQNNHKPAYIYGSIHIRTRILRLSGMTDTELMKNVTPKLAKILDIVAANSTSPNVTEWWVVADEPAMTVFFQEQLQHAFMDRQWRFVHDIPPAKVSSSDLEYHSFNTKGITGAFKQQDMSVSILDWMILWESALAIVTTGAYGATGAQGNYKFPKRKKEHGLQAFW